MKPIINVEDVSRNFQVGRETIHALRKVNLNIEKGALTILKGRSGSGKTTLINLIGLIDNPNEGCITILDKQTSQISEVERDNLRKKEFGFVFQSGALIPNMNVHENLELVLRLLKIKPDKRKVRIKECVELVGLSKKTNLYPEELSGGEMQRVGIARAIAHKPQIILADEPTSALDFNTGLKVVKLFKELISKEGITMVMTTHDPKLTPIADYMYNLRDGEVVNE